MRINIERKGKRSVEDRQAMYFAVIAVVDVITTGVPAEAFSYEVV